MSPLILKQCRAIIDERTTVICLQMHGVAVPVEVSFETLAGDFQQPPFHISCRTIVTPAIRGYVAQARKEANAELQRRPKKQRRRGPNNEIGGSIPPPTKRNPPSGFSFREIQNRNTGAIPRPHTRSFRPEGVDFRNAERGSDAAFEVLRAQNKRGLRPSEREALEDYAEGDSTFLGLNRALRFRDQLTTVQTVLQVILDRLIGESKLNKDIVVFRGLPAGADIRVGTTVEEPSFLSTSLSIDVATRFADDGAGVVLELLVPKDSEFLAVGGRIGAKPPKTATGAMRAMAADREVLLGRGHMVRYVSEHIRDVDGKDVRVVRGEIILLR